MTTHMGTKWNLSRKDIEALSKSTDEPVTVSQAKAAEPKADWADNTRSSWREHSGFIENSKIANISPPPRLDPRLVPRPKAPTAPAGLSETARRVLLVIVLIVGVCGGLYSNGVFDTVLKHYWP